VFVGVKVTPGNPDEASDEETNGRKKGKRKGKRSKKSAVASNKETSVVVPMRDVIPHVPCDADSLIALELREHGQALTREMFEGK
jgi:hypothetical protein